MTPTIKWSQIELTPRGEERFDKLSRDFADGKIRDDQRLIRDKRIALDSVVGIAHEELTAFPKVQRLLNALSELGQ